MTNREALQYAVDHIREYSYVKGPIYVDGVSHVFKWPPDPLVALNRARDEAAKWEKHIDVIKDLQQAVAFDVLPKLESLTYAFAHIDHPEIGSTGYPFSLCHPGPYDRPKSKDVALAAQERVAKIERWEQADFKLRTMIAEMSSPEPIRVDHWGNRYQSVDNGTQPSGIKYL